MDVFPCTLEIVSFSGSAMVGVIDIEKEENRHWNLGILCSSMLFALCKLALIDASKASHRLLIGSTLIKNHGWLCPFHLLSSGVVSLVHWIC